MPSMDTEPEIVLEYNGVKIYRTYRNDNFNDPREYNYGYSEDCNDDGEDSFDIRDLPNYDETRSHEEILKEAIDQGILSQDGVNI